MIHTNLVGSLMIRDGWACRSCPYKILHKTFLHHLGCTVGQGSTNKIEIHINHRMILQVNPLTPYLD